MSASLDELLTERLEEVVRRVVAEMIGPIHEQLARLTPGPVKPQTDEDELSLRQIKEQYGYSPDTVRGWIDDDKLPAKKGAKEWRVRRGDLKVKIGMSSKGASVVDIRSKAAKMLAGGRGRP